MADDEDTIYWNGESYGWDDLTFREQHAVFALLREKLPVEDQLDPGAMHIVPAMAVMVARRTEPTYSWEQAIELKPGDLKAPAPPTRAKRAAKTSS